MAHPRQELRSRPHGRTPQDQGRQGQLQIGDRTLQAGDFLYTPSGSVHEVKALADSVTLISVPEPLPFL
ncbi:MAG: JmjC domain-containing protein [Mycobacteriaceae bacterium]